MIDFLLAAALITPHTSFHVPDGDAHNALHREGCLDTKTFMVKSYEKERMDRDKFEIRGADIR